MSGYWANTDDVTTKLQPAIASGPPTDFGENFTAARQDMLVNNNAMSMFNDLTEAYSARTNEIYLLTGKRLENPMLSGAVTGGPGLVTDVLTPGSEFFRKGQIDNYEAQVDELRKSYPQLINHDQMMKRLADKSQQIEGLAADTSSRATFAGKIGNIAGTMQGSVQDPVNLITLPLGAAKGAGLLRGALMDAAAVGGTELATQPQVQASRIERGQQGGVSQAAENIAAAAGGAAVLSLAVRGTLLAGGKLLKKYDETIKNPTADQQAARDLYGRVVDINESSPLDSAAPAAVEEHNARLTAAMKSLEAGQADPALTPSPAAPIASTALQGNLDNLDGVIWKFNPADLQTDAKTFQFKEGGDNAGVTDRLKGVKQWDPVKAGQVIVFEDGAGKQFIADGHQRLGLAQRLQQAAPDQNIQLYGTLFREADGYTPEMVRVIAAMKNIAEGTGTAIDAAKVLRVDPARLSQLPPNSALVRQAGDMVNLSDPAFGMVVNEVVPANYAAIVGRLVEDPQLQEAIMGVLAKTEPANVTQAESIVRQAMDAGTKTEIQGGLFGDEAITTSLYLERSKILDKGLKKLRLDAKVFDTLIKNEDSIAAEGNVLSRNANEARAQTDARAVQLIQLLANRKGPLSDALTAAARRAADEGKYTNATGDFVTAVRSAIERGDFEGLSAGGAGRLEQVEAENAARAVSAADARPDEQSLKLFDEPGGAGSEQQARALEADLRASVEPPAAAEPPAAVDLFNVRHPVHDLTYDEALAVMQGLPETIHSPEFNSPARQALRDEIVNKLYGTGARLKNKVVDLVLGPPGAGKSSVVVRELKERHGALEIDADLAKEHLPEFDHGLGANAVHEESKMIVEAGVLDKALTAGDNIVFPIVGSNPVKLQQIVDKFRKVGYTVNVRLVDIPAEQSLERVVRRFGAEGRLLPPDYVLGIGNKPKESFYAAIKTGQTSQHTHFDNHVAFGEKPRIIASNDPHFPELPGAGNEVPGANPGSPHSETGQAGLTVDKTAVGDQTVLPGAEKISDRQLIERKSNEKLKSGAQQQPADIGLFDTAGRAQMDLLDRQIPAGLKVDPETGEVTAATASIKDILAGIDRDAADLEAIGKCGRP